jgi:hypothetical protein
VLTCAFLAFISVTLMVRQLAHESAGDMQMVLSRVGSPAQSAFILNGQVRRSCVPAHARARTLTLRPRTLVLRAVRQLQLRLAVPAERQLARPGLRLLRRRCVQPLELLRASHL